MSRFDCTASSSNTFSESKNTTHKYINIKHTYIQTVVKRHSHLLTPLKTKIKLNYSEKFRSYRAVNTLHPAYEKQIVDVL